MNIRIVLWTLPLLALGCSKKDQPSTSALLSQVKQGLSERDAKVGSYHLVGTTAEGTHEAKFEFFYRFPNKMKGVLTAPAQKTFAFDGQKLFERSEAEKQLTTFNMKLPPHKSLLVLTQTFAPFAPEGYRIPLLNQNVTATKVSDPKAPEAVELKLTAQEGGQTVGVTYLLRWPSLDFLRKTAEGHGRVVEVRVEDEHCDSALKLCFPKRLTQWEQGKQVGETAMATVEINPPLPVDSFTLAVPEGFQSVERELVESP